MHDEASTTAPPEPVEVDAAIARRRAIQAIMRDTTISGQDKAHRIQSLMSGGRTEVAPPPAPVIPMSDAGTGSAACVHYERNCNIVAPCCNRIYGCRICHDELSPPGHPPLDRFLIREVICKNCNTRQAATNQCVDCQTVFGEYHCGTCNLWMSTVCYYFVVVVAFRYWWFNYSPARLIYYLTWLLHTRPRNLFIATYAGSVVWGVPSPFVIAQNVACAYPCRSMRASTSSTKVLERRFSPPPPAHSVAFIYMYVYFTATASRTNTRTIVRSVARTCSLRASRRKIYRADTPFTPTAFANWPALTIAVRFARKRSCRNRAWRPPGRRERGILLSIPCRPICNARSISFATIVRSKAPIDSGTFSASSALRAALSIRWWKMC
jgi:uncharacterized CHY-type Zn-finger protein